MKSHAKCLGLIANLSDSLLGAYTTTINSEVQKELSGNHSADIRVCCVDWAKLDALLNDEDGDAVTALLSEYGRGLVLAGADGLVICGSKLNPFAAGVRAALKVPVIDMAFAVATKLRDEGHSYVGIVSPSTSREKQWWRENLSDITVIHPSDGECEWLNDRLTDAVAGHRVELNRNIDADRILVGLRNRNAGAVVWSSPVFDRWMKADEFMLDAYDAAVIHAWAAALWALYSGSDLRSAPHCVLA